jgi:hypothetical protein
MWDVSKPTASSSGCARLAAAAALLWNAQMAVAQTAGPTLSGSDAELETVVVTAQRRSEDIQTVPISIQAFSGKAGGSRHQDFLRHRSIQLQRRDCPALRRGQSTNPFGFIEGIIGTPRIVGVELNWRY